MKNTLVCQAVLLACMNDIYWSWKPSFFRHSGHSGVHQLSVSQTKKGVAWQLKDIFQFSSVFIKPGHLITLMGLGWRDRSMGDSEKGAFYITLPNLKDAIFYSGFISIWLFIITIICSVAFWAYGFNDCSECIVYIVAYSKYLNARLLDLSPVSSIKLLKLLM